MAPPPADFICAAAGRITRIKRMIPLFIRQLIQRDFVGDACIADQRGQWAVQGVHFFQNPLGGTGRRHIQRMKLCRATR